MGKRGFLILFFCGIILFTASCGSGGSSGSSGSGGSESPSNVSNDGASQGESVKPILRIKSAETKVFINQGEEFDLLRGITGSDGFGGDLTARIQINAGNYDPNKPGEYIIVYFLAKETGEAANPVTRTVIVKDSSIFPAPEVFTGVIEGKIKNPKAPTLFGGAWYHKVVSSKDVWRGIEGTVTLPEVVIKRYDGNSYPALDVDPSAKNLDNPSVYMGGYALSESDVGLSFSKALVDVGAQKLSAGSIAFRPFWRYITSENQDAGGYDAHGGEYAVSANGNNCIANYHWRYTEYYYLPGDTLRIIIFIPEPNKMQLQIEVIEKSTLPSSVEIREKYGWKDPANFKSPIFHSPGHGTGIAAEYKRVNAIDQVANEGGIAHATQTEIKSALWHETYLYREIGGALYRVPMDESRRAALSAPDAAGFIISFDGADKDEGGESVTISPGRVGDSTAQ